MKSLVVMFLLSTMFSYCVTGLTSCTKTYYKLGCYQDRVWRRTLSQLLFTDRDRHSHVTSGTSIDWKNWEDYMHSLACRCAERARALGYSIFGLQYYGECWSGPGACSSYESHGESRKCIGRNMTTCDIDSSSECVGGPNTNYIYMLLEDSLPPQATSV